MGASGIPLHTNIHEHTRVSDLREDRDVRIIFAGTPDVAVPTLRALAEAHDVVLVITRTDAPVGRKRVMTPSVVAVVAEELELPVLKSNTISEQDIDTIRNADADLGVVVAYGALLREPVLSLPKRGWLNIHFSSLPRWRGAAPVQWALIAGDRTVGTTIFQLDEGLDTGAILSQSEHAVPPTQNAGELLAELAERAPKQLLPVLDALERNLVIPREQIGEVTLAPKLRREDAHLDFSQPAHLVLSRWAGVTPEPGAFTQLGDQILKLTRLCPATPSEEADNVDLNPGVVELRESEVVVGTGTSPICILRVQPAGKREMDAGDWYRGTSGNVILS